MVHLQTEDLRNKVSSWQPATWFADHIKSLSRDALDEKKRSVHVDSLHRTWLKKQKPLDRTMQFWRRSLSIYASYKVCQLRTRFFRSKEAKDKAWEDQHEWAAVELHSLCSELGGFFLKAAQLIGKPDLAPDAWVKRLVTLCDAAPSTPYATVKLVLEQELGLPTEELFEEFHKDPIGSASVAQVHRARIRGAKHDVAVKVQHPGVEELMMTDICNLRTFAAFVKRFDMKFDMVSVIDELKEQVGLEFDFMREARSMDRIADSLSVSNDGKQSVLVPRPISGMVTRRVLLMDFMEGTPILRLGEEIAKRGVDPNGAVANIAKRNILRDLTAAYGHMILKDGFFQADPHPGNILINRKGKVVLLDYGQVKELPDKLRLNYAKLVLALCTGEPFEIGHCLERLGLVTGKKVEDDPAAYKVLAMSMFDTKLPSGCTKLTPFGEESLLSKFPVENFPKELFFVLRTVQLLRGLSVGMGVPLSCSEEWKGFAWAALSEAKQERDDLNLGTGGPRELIWEKRKMCRRCSYLHSMWNSLVSAIV